MTTVTQTYWDQCDDPAWMLRWLTGRGEAGGRKGRLLAAACCSLLVDWVGLEDLNVIDAVERFADGGVSKAALRRE